MSLRLVLASAALIAMTGPAFAQQAPAAPPAPAPPPAAAQTPQEITPEQRAVVARIEAAGTALEAMMTELEPRAAAVRADASLSAEDKETRIRAMLAEHQPTLDEFTAALNDMILMQAASEGASPEEAAQAAAMVRGMVSTQIAQALITGEDPDQDGGE